MKKAKIIISFCVLLAFLGSLAMANGLNLNSLGSKALAMGGAFVGLADDFSAIYWNPAGMGFFKTKYFGFYGTDIIPSGKYKMGITHPLLGKIILVDAQTMTKHYLAGLAGYYHPINENLVAGIGVYIPSGLGATWDGADFAAISENKSYEWNSRIGLISIAPALAYKINDMVSIGGSLNINYGMFDLMMHAGTTDPPKEIDLGQYEESMSGWGFGATFGILVKPSEMISLGATVRTASTVSFSGEATISNLSLLGLNTTSDVKRNVTWPWWIAGGLAFKPITNLTLTADLQWSSWSKIDVMETDFVDPYWKIMMAQSGDDKRQMHWANAMQIRIGGEYRLNEALALRGGYYYDPSPAPDKTMNVLVPSYSFNVITLGLGYSLSGLQLDFGFEYLMGKEREVDYVKVLTDPDYKSAMPGTYNMKMIVPNISISYKF